MLSVLLCTIKVCCMALNIHLINPHFYGFQPAGLVPKYLLINGAGNGSRTRLSCLEGRRTSRCTTPAWAGHPGRGYPWEDRNFKERGEDFFLIPVLLLYKKFLEKSTYFLRNHRQYSWYASSRLGYGRPHSLFHLYQLLTRLSQYCSKEVPTVS